VFRIKATQSPATLRGNRHSTFGVEDEHEKAI
jgi:hypothetical protein